MTFFSAANVPTASGFCATRKGIPLETFTATQTVPEAAQKSVQRKNERKKSTYQINYHSF